MNRQNHRGRLATHKIPDFATWAGELGYVREPTPARAAYEVLRLRPPSGGAPLLYFRSDGAGVHVTAQKGAADGLVRRWLRERGPRGGTPQQELQDRQPRDHGPALPVPGERVTVSRTRILLAEGVVLQVSDDADTSQARPEDYLRLRVEHSTHAALPVGELVLRRDEGARAWTRARRNQVVLRGLDVQRLVGPCPP